MTVVPAERNSPLVAFVALVVSAAATYLATGLHPIWWLMWLAPIPILLASTRLPGRMTFLAAFASWFIGGLNMWTYYHAILEMPLPVIAIVLVGSALLFALAVLAFRRARRASVWRAAFIFPAFWVSLEFLSAAFSPHGTAGNIGYTQMNFLPALQIASITGIWGISFCITLFAATVATLLGSSGPADGKRGLAFAVGVFLLAVLGFGVVRLHSTAEATDTMKVGLVASDLPQNILTESSAETLRLMREYAAQAERLAAQGAQAVVIPEKVSVVLDSDLAQIDGVLSQTAAEVHATIVVGVIHPTGGAKWNEAREYSPDGTIRTYKKHHMVPGFESKLTVGTSRTTWQEQSGKWGMAICKDMDFPKLSREYGRDGVGLMLVPAWDFKADGWLHGRMGILRGVEEGFSIARSPKQGILTVTDDRGRVLAEKESSIAPFATVIVDVPVSHGSTLYSHFGDWFAWLNVVGGIILLVSRKKS